MPPPWAVYFRRRDDRRRISRPLMCGVEVEIVGLSDGPLSHASCVRSLLKTILEGNPHKLPRDGTDQDAASPSFFVLLPLYHDGDVIGHTLGSGPASLLERYGSTKRCIDSGVPFGRASGCFWWAG